MRDYGTGEWEGGDPDCDHSVGGQVNQTVHAGRGHGNDFTTGQRPGVDASRCRKCGATRVDQQLGLEPTPDLFVQRMVEVFREIRRVLAAHGTCFVNLGDSYVSQPSGSKTVESKLNRSGLHFSRATLNDAHTRARLDQANAVREQWRKPPGLKPKDLTGIPWRVAFALQADGWYLRSDIIWAKPNPMPESVTDRPTKSHEYVFLLTKSPRYWFDQEAVREPMAPASEGRYSYSFGGAKNAHLRDTDQVHTRPFGDREPTNGRNVRSVWQIATQPYPEAHFATFPEELARRCILAGCPLEVCRVCGKARERVVEPLHANGDERSRRSAEQRVRATGGAITGGTEHSSLGAGTWAYETTGYTDCGHSAYRPGIVLDPFIGSGTVAKVARDHGRHAIGIDLNADYLALAAKRLQQLSLLAEPA